MGTIMAVDIIVYRTQVLWLKLGACSVSEHISPFYPDQVNGLSVKSLEVSQQNCCSTVCLRMNQISQHVTMATPRSQNANGASLLYEREVNYTSLTTDNADNFTFYIHKGPLFPCV